MLEENGGLWFVGESVRELLIMSNIETAILLAVFR